MSCFLQTAGGDLDLTSGQLALVRDPDQCTAIKLTNRFRFFLGEWFMDARLGVPYFQTVFVRNPDLQAISQLFKRILLQTPNVQDVLSVGIDFISSLRLLQTSFKAQTKSGAIIVGGPGDPFLVIQNGKGQG